MCKNGGFSLSGSHILFLLLIYLGLKSLVSKITKGGSTCPLALTHAITVISTFVS